MAHGTGGPEAGGRPTDRLVGFALGLPEAWEDDPWGERVVKVGKKVFVVSGSHDARPRVTVKLPDSHPAALAARGTAPAGYGLGRAGWVVIHLDVEGGPPLDEIEEWIDESYRAVAPKRLVRVLDARTGP